MRSDAEMMERIIQTAKGDDRVLAAYLKGSRANPNVPRDCYQDFDVMYVVRETESFRRDTSWLAAFGTVILQREQDSEYGYGHRFGIRSHYEETYSWLLLFADGTRIDIGVETTAALEQGKNRNRLFLPLLDKVGCLPQLPPPSDREFWVKRPTQAQFQSCCTEFFWDLCDVVKGIARDEIPFAMTTYHTLVRSMLEQMLSWYAGLEHQYAISCGKLNKYLKVYLPASCYSQYLDIYSDSVHLTTAIAAACRLFRETALALAAALQFSYPQSSEDGFRTYAEIVGKQAGFSIFT